MLQDEIDSAGRARHARRHEVLVNGCCRAGSGFAKRADVDATIHYAIKAWATWFGRDECPRLR